MNRVVSYIMLATLERFAAFRKAYDDWMSRSQAKTMYIEEGAQGKFYIIIDKQSHLIGSIMHVDQGVTKLSISRAKSGDLKIDALVYLSISSRYIITTRPDINHRCWMGHELHEDTHYCKHCATLRVSVSRMLATGSVWWRADVLHDVKRRIARILIQLVLE